MSIRSEYRLHFDCDEGETSFELSANELEGELAVWINTPMTNHRDERLLKLNRDEALELKAVLSVLTGTASPDEEALVGVVA
ncbi:MAG TPA: hypothetical protein VNP96_08390 [Solirubrobacterales bacterium]|nr:hypothetical protein [Solirubrobacterales bacterium]